MADSDEENDAILGDNEDNDEKRTQKIKKNKKKHQSYIAEDGGNDIVDFLDPSAAQNVTSTMPKPKSSELDDQHSKSRNGGFKIAKDGRLIIEDDSDSEEEQHKKKLHFMESDGSDDEGKNGKLTFFAYPWQNNMPRHITKNIKCFYFSDTSKNTFRDLVHSSSARKRKHGGSVASSKRSALSSMSIESRPMKYKAGGTGIHRPLNGSSSGNRFPDYGAEYRAKKGKGDVKRKDKPDPYAYIPLKKESLNKRKKAKFEGQFKGIVKAAQKGSAAGKKSGKITKKMKHLKM